MKWTTPVLAFALALAGCSTPSSRESTPTSVAQDTPDPEPDPDVPTLLQLAGGVSASPAVRSALQEYAAKSYPDCAVVGVASGLKCQGRYLSSLDLTCKGGAAQKNLTVEIAVRQFVAQDNKPYWKAEAATDRYTDLFKACLFGQAKKSSYAE